MAAAEKTLHWAVEKWLAPTPSMPARVVEFCHRASQHRRFVRVEALRPGGLLSIFFFRHDDGSWNVFPPQAERPAMNGYRRTGLCAAASLTSH
ncbi:hypothetical protein [Paraburkholderia phenoliruptrix]|uniref:hypothetical protein n=1 Tax=Paraburkholderia phenoliruptrix TaxID=252970 RepID=UPI001C6F0D54|nr:hypothetical protein [Paraburkholderia phenoliruptrix]MBW9107202.1 hypothetical protein [Paraburkholderia phenoliruptrix]MBW9132223.1 hypothetical protein [Paraburkholderia ginsengiterrae]